MPEVTHDVRTSRDSLRLERLNLAERYGVQFVRNDTQQIFFQRKFVDDGECVSGISKDLDFSTVTSIVEFDRHTAGVDLRFHAFRQNNNSSTIQLHKGAVLKIRVRHHPRSRRIQREDHRELGRPSTILLDCECIGGAQTHRRSVLSKADSYCRCGLRPHWALIERPYSQKQRQKTAFPHYLMLYKNVN